jgi:hypothetical protein
MELSPVPSLAPFSMSTCSLLASRFFSLSSDLGAGDFGVEPAWTGVMEAGLSFTVLLVREVFHHSRIFRSICPQFTAMMDTSATRYVIKDTTTVVILYSRVVWSTSFWNIVIPNTVLEKVRLQMNFSCRKSIAYRYKARRKIKNGHHRENNYIAIQYRCSIGFTQGACVKKL